ncbi:hypothetical protein pipiens_012569 [Culex pipiens pipiens]|uniref:Uncharacterized protein n=1 Tax=Culex pipiens pipiens TaxID=38569 RepID=A0ABD1D207_CULPP
MSYKRFATRLWLWCKSRVTAYHGVLTKDFNYSSDFFFGMDFLMVTAGIRFRSDNVNLQRCWNIYRWLIYCPLIVALWNTYLGNESIGWAVYELAWPTELQYDERFQVEYRSVREAMAIVMTVSQQPLGLDCFGLFEFNLEQFYELLNMAYSFYTFLRDFV